MNVSVHERYKSVLGGHANVNRSGSTQCTVPTHQGVQTLTEIVNNHILKTELILWSMVYMMYMNIIIIIGNAIL